MENQVQMAEPEAIQSVVMQVAIQAATAAVIAIREAEIDMCEAQAQSAWEKHGDKDAEDQH